MRRIRRVVQHSQQTPVQVGALLRPQVHEALVDQPLQTLAFSPSQRRIDKDVMA